jgi:hypothetical protein
MKNGGKMNVFDKSLLALDQYLAKANQDDLQKVLDEVEEMEFEGPNLEEFFTSIFQSKPLRFKFQEGVFLCTNHQPPPQGFQLTNQQTPKFPLESFFFVTSQHGSCKPRCF